MGRFLPFCVLPALFTCVSGCADAPSRPSGITDPPGNAAKASARYIQAPWDISLPGVAGAATAATTGDTLTGTFVNSTGFAGTLTGTLDNGTFTGSLKTITPSGCPAERQFTGPLTAQTLHWSPGPQINDCGGASPLTATIEAPAAPPSASPCTYASTVSAASIPGTGGSVTVTVTAGAGCTWFATSSDSFVTLSAGQGTADGTVQFTFAANPSGTPRTAMLVVAVQSFEITQAGATAPVCRYGLNDSARTFDAAGALGGVDMRVAAGCAWQAQSDAPWLTITSGSAGTGDGAINFAVAANPGLGQRVGTITAAGASFTVTQNGISCAYTVTPPATTAFPTAGGSGTVGVATQAACAWAATSGVPWITVTAPAGATGPGSVAFTVAANNEQAARTGTVTVAGQAIAITQAAPPCPVHGHGIADLVPGRRRGRIRVDRDVRRLSLGCNVGIAGTGLVAPAPKSGQRHRQRDRHVQGHITGGPPPDTAYRENHHRRPDRHCYPDGNQNLNGVGPGNEQPEPRPGGRRDGRGGESDSDDRARRDLLDRQRAVRVAPGGRERAAVRHNRGGQSPDRLRAPVQSGAGSRPAVESVISRHQQLQPQLPLRPSSAPGTAGEWSSRPGASPCVDGQ